jgi:NTE family protein
MSAPRIGLILTGGGARAAYQVGVLSALAILAAKAGASPVSPFRIITGTSAGALNAAALAGRADDFGLATHELLQTWSSMQADQVYRTDSLGLIRTGVPWLSMLTLGWALSRWSRLQPRSLLDNQPLIGLLARMIRIDRIQEMLSNGHLDALAVTASSYTTGQHITFYDSPHPIDPWTRTQRIAERTRIGMHHLLASAAIPFIFPAVALRVQGMNQWCGDGAIRQTAPISPAIHLGADRVMVIGSGRLQSPDDQPALQDLRYPSVAQVAGQALSNIFLDSLAVDIERLQRINSTLALIPPEQRQRTPLRPVQALIIAPSQRLDDLASTHFDQMPRTLRALLRGIGVGPGSGTGAALTSYLLFQQSYTRELIRLGQTDALARQADIRSFFGWNDAMESTYGTLSSVAIASLPQ